MPWSRWKVSAFSDVTWSRFFFVGVKVKGLTTEDTEESESDGCVLPVIAEVYCLRSGPREMGARGERHVSFGSEARRCLLSALRAIAIESTARGWLLLHPSLPFSERIGIGPSRAPCPR